MQHTHETNRDSTRRKTTQTLPMHEPQLHKPQHLHKRREENLVTKPWRKTETEQIQELEENKETIMEIGHQLLEARKDPTKYFVCPICGLFRFGDPPHGQNTPCPEKLKINQATIDMMQTNKDTLLGEGMATNDMSATIKKMVDSLTRNTYDEDDNE